MRVDAFCHLIPTRFAERVDALGDVPAARNLRTRTAGIPSLVDLDLRLRQLEEFGDDYVQIPSLPAPALEDLGAPAVSAELARGANEELAALVAEQERFVGWVAGLPMNDPDAAVAEARRAVSELGALGVQIYTHVNGRSLDDPRFEPLFATMHELDRPIWVHPARTAAWPDFPTEERSRYEIWWTLGWPYATSVFMARVVFAGLLDRYPRLKILTHHAGAMIPFFSGRVGPGWDQLGARTPDADKAEVETPLSGRPLDYFKRFYADTAVFGAPHALRCALAFFGVEHTLFASDSPFDPERGPGYIRATIADIESLGLSEEDRRRIYEGNARDVLGVRI